MAFRATAAELVRADTDHAADRRLRGTRLAARSGSARQRYIIIGANEVGVELKRRVSHSVGMGKFMGFFDFRSLERLPQDARSQFAGLCKEVAEFVRTNGVNAIYITCR